MYNTQIAGGADELARQSIQKEIDNSWNPISNMARRLNRDELGKVRLDNNNNIISSVGKDASSVIKSLDEKNINPSKDVNYWQDQKLYLENRMDKETDANKIIKISKEIEKADNQINLINSTNERKSKKLENQYTGELDKRISKLKEAKDNATSEIVKKNLQKAIDREEFRSNNGIGLETEITNSQIKRDKSDQRSGDSATNIRDGSSTKIKPVLDGGDGGDNLDAVVNEDTSKLEQTDGTPAADIVTNGQKATPEAKDAAVDQIKGMFGEMFDPKELMRMAILYLGARATGASGGQAMAFAGKQYLQRLDKKQDERKFNKHFNELNANSNKTEDSMKLYKHFRDPSVLVDKPSTLVKTIRKGSGQNTLNLMMQMKKRVIQKFGMLSKVSKVISLETQHCLQKNYN